MEFEWDPKKAQANLEKHGVDFEDAIGIFEGPTLEHRSDRNNEERGQAIGEIGGVVLSVAYTMRGERRRIISARKADRNERRAYRAAYHSGPEEGSD